MPLEDLTMFLSLLGNHSGLEQALVGTFSAIAGIRAMANAHAESREACRDFCVCDDAEGLLYMLQSVATTLEGAALPYSRKTREALLQLKENGCPEITVRGPADILCNPSTN
jgi:hypothetical protein